MKKYRKISVEPLTKLESLKLKKASETRYDMSVLSGDQQKELMSKLLAEVHKVPGAIVAHQVGGVQHIGVAIKTKNSEVKGKFFSFAEPNVIHIYYLAAVVLLEGAEGMRKVFFERQGGQPDEAYKAFCDFFYEMAPGIVLLMMTLEGFFNQLLEEDAVYTIDGQEKRKGEIEWMNLKDKLRDVIPVLTGIDLIESDKVMYDRLLALNSLRNDLIHLRKLDAKNYTYYQELFKQLLDFQSDQAAEAVFGCIQIVKAGFFEEAESK